MSKTRPVNTRFETAEFAALKRAATSDKRPVSTMLRVIVVQWLSDNGWLKASPRVGEETNDEPT